MSGVVEGVESDQVRTYHGLQESGGHRKRAEDLGSWKRNVHEEYNLHLNDKNSNSDFVS